MTKEQQKLATVYAKSNAIDNVVSVYSIEIYDKYATDEISAEEFFEHWETGVWEPFENHRIDDLEEIVDDLTTAFYNAIVFGFNLDKQDDKSGN